MCLIETRAILYSSCPNHSDLTSLESAILNTVKNSDTLYEGRRTYARPRVHSSAMRAWIFKEIHVESVPLNLGKCKKFRNTHNLWMQRRGAKEMRRLRRARPNRALATGTTNTVFEEYTVFVTGYVSSRDF